jgi:hypothetical protein
VVLLLQVSTNKQTIKQANDRFKTPFDLKEYIAWKSQQQDQVEPNIIPSSQPIEPVYPSSFMHLCDLVAKGVQIAGIKQIPLKINELQAKEACLERRKKPWE